MFSRLKQWYSLEIYEKDEERRLAQIQLGFHLVFWIATGVLLLLDIIWQDPILALTLLGAGTLQILSLWYLFRGRLNVSAMLSAGVYIAAATILAAIGQGTHDHSILIYPIAIMLAGLTNQRRGLFIATLLSLIGATALFLAETAGWIPREHLFVSTWPNMVILAGLILVSTILVYHLVANAE